VALLHPPSTHVQYRACRYDTDGCTVWVHRCTCIAATRRGYMMYNRHRVMQWRICKPASPPGVRFPLPPLRQSSRKRTVNTEGCRKSCTYIFVHSIHLHSSSPFYEPRIRFRIASLTLLTCTNAREKDASTLA